MQTALGGPLGLMMIIPGLAFGLAVYLLGRRFFDGFWNRLGGRVYSDAEYIYTLAERMFKDWSLARCQQAVWLCGLAGVAVGLLSTMHLSWLTTVVGALLLGWLGMKLPRAAVNFMHRRYVDKFEDQFVDSLVMMSSALRSGLSLNQGIDLVAEEMPEPTGQEFGLVLRENRMGKTIDEALAAMAERIPSEDLNLFVNSVLILRETGGNLAETFDTIVFTVSERDKVRGKVKTMTAQGVAQGAILIAMPFVMAAVLHVLNPEYMRPMYTTTLGWVMLGFMLVLQALGAFMMRKIINIEV